MALVDRFEHGLGVVGNRAGRLQAEHFLERGAGPLARARRAVHDQPQLVGRVAERHEDLQQPAAGAHVRHRGLQHDLDLVAAIERDHRQRVDADADVEDHEVVARRGDAENPLEAVLAHLGGLDRVAGAREHVEVFRHVRDARVEKRAVEPLDLRAQLRQRRRRGFVADEERRVGELLVHVDQQHAALEALGDLERDVAGREARAGPALARHERHDPRVVGIAPRALRGRPPERVAERLRVERPLQHVACAGAHRVEQHVRRRVGRHEDAGQARVRAADALDRRQFGRLERRAVDQQDVERVEPVGAMLDLRRAAGRTGRAIASAVGHETRDLREPRGIVGSYEDVDHVVCLVCSISCRRSRPSRSSGFRAAASS